MISDFQDMHSKTIRLRAPARTGMQALALGLQARLISPTLAQFDGTLLQSIVCMFPMWWALLESTQSSEHASRIDIALDRILGTRLVYCAAFVS